MIDGNWGRRLARSQVVFGLYCLMLAVGSVAAAENVAVVFDCNPTVACRDVTPQEFSEKRPSQKVVEATIRVSVRVTSGDSSDLQELLFELLSPEQRLPILSFLPATTLESEAAEPIQISRTIEKHRSIGASLGAALSVPYGDVKVQASPGANLGASKRDLRTETWKKPPLKRPVIVSGTTHNSHGVFFKYKPSRDASLEGVKELQCRFVVPASWRGDWMLLSCRATGKRTRYFVTSEVVCGQQRYVLGLHRNGDAEARDLARALALAQSPLELPADPAPSTENAKRTAGRVRLASLALRQLAGDHSSTQKKDGAARDGAAAAEKAGSESAPPQRDPTAAPQDARSEKSAVDGHAAFESRSAEDSCGG